MFKNIFPLTLIISLRMFGLFIVLPVLSIYIPTLEGSNHTMIGIIIGGYALTQMIFQVPFGKMSDKIGRRKAIVIGLAIYAFGSLLAGIANNVYLLLIGRFFQGAGAIGAVITATISDIVKEEQRGKAMAIMGGSIAVAFALSMVAGPVVASKYGVPILFIVATIIALISIYILIKYVPKPPVIKHSFNDKSTINPLTNANLMKMNITNVLVKGLMTFAFMIIPMYLTNDYNWEMKELYKIYLPAMIIGVFSMGPAVVFAEKKGKFKSVLLTGIVILAISYFIIGYSSTSLLFCIGVILFFVGFNLQEPILQSFVSKYAKVHQRGEILGVFNSFGYLGTFLGGAVGGFMLDYITLEHITYGIIFVSIFWILMILTLENPAHTKNLYVHINDTNLDRYKQLHNVKGIKEWYINKTESLLVIKYEQHIISKEEVEKYI